MLRIFTSPAPRRYLILPRRDSRVTFHLHFLTSLDTYHRDFGGWRGFETTFVTKILVRCNLAAGYTALEWSRE